MQAEHDPSGPWTQHPKRAEILAAQRQLVWVLVREFASSAKHDKVFKSQLNKMLKQATWAATETTRSKKYDLRYISEGVLDLCRKQGSIRSWTRRRATDRPALIHEHVLERAYLNALLLDAKSEKDVASILNLAESCVVTPDEDKNRLKKGRGWERYENVRVWDRLLHEWKNHV